MRNPEATNTVRRLVLLTALVLATASPQAIADDKTFSPSFYAFENGVKYETVAQGAAHMKELGYDGVGSVHANVLDEFLKEFDAAGLKTFSIYVGGRVSANDFTYDPSVTRAIRALKGRDSLVELFVLAGKDPNDTQATAFVREIAAEAEKAGLRVVLYPHDNLYIETIGDALRIAKASGCTNVGVAFNLCHFMKVEPESDLHQTLKAAKPWLWSVSTCGADRGGTNWDTLIQPLDKGTFDQAELLRHLREIGYTGDIGLQCYAIKEPSSQHLARSLDAWKSALAASLRN
ncbi:sugar phosphate isomerase/epimerase family protein [Haloferula sp.]|uniref:sugar phosphate isomerase/epimerase family protein n=1 Tax=Haloferula sp. TaxID=2497595 RepID=UPI003C760DC8